MSTDRAAQILARIIDNVTRPEPVGYHHVTDVKGHQMNLPHNTMMNKQHLPRVAQAAEKLAARQAAWNFRTRAEAAEAREVRDNLIRHQGITILTQLSGPQYVTATAMNLGMVGAYLTVVIGTVVMTFHTKTAATRYAQGWNEYATWALKMPAWQPMMTRTNRYTEPGVIVSATEDDRIITAPGETLKIFCGRVSWEVLDRRAFTDVHRMWREVLTRADEIWPTPHR